MAFSGNISGTVEALVSRLTSVSADDRAFKRLKDRAIKGLRDTSHGRTNPFHVSAQLSGLVEKFSVVNRDPLAEALQVRLDELSTLPTRSTCTPDVLALLLRLSDRPAEKTAVEDLEGLNGPEILPLDVTWEDIFTNDPSTEDDIWENVERGYHSSGDERPADPELDSEPTISTQATSFDEEDVAALGRLHVSQPDQSTLDGVHPVHGVALAHNQREDDLELPELAVIRETLTMLHGLPTSLYTMDSKTGQVSTHKRVTLSTSRWSTLNDVLSQCANIGSKLNSLRNWVQSTEALAYVQSIQACIQQHLKNLTASLATLEQRFITPRHGVVISILYVQSEVEALSRPFLQWSDIVSSTLAASKHHPYALLRNLHNATCLSQVVGDQRTFGLLATTLFAGLETYLRPVQVWISSGTLPSRDDYFFVVTRADVTCELGEIWHKRFALRKADDGEPCAPEFMQPFRDQMFAMGKTRAFLNLLNRTEESVEARPDDSAAFFPRIEQVKSRLEIDPLVPFTQLLDELLKSWITGIGTDCTSVLHHKLFHDHGFAQTLRSLQYVFFARDGASFQTFADALFTRMDNAPRSWKNAFLLTELAQSTIGAVTGVDEATLVIRIPPRDSNDGANSVTQSLQNVKLDYILPWPIQNITRSPTPTTHSKVLILLLQTYRAKVIVRSSAFFGLRALRANTSSLGSQVTTALLFWQRLTCFVDLLHAHITTTACVLHGAMCAQLQAAGGLDAMAAAWREYESKLERSLLLAPNLAPLRKAVVGVLELSDQCSHLWTRLSTQKGSRDRETEIETATMPPAAPAPDLALLDPQALLDDLDKSLSFIRAGLRGVSRTAGDQALEALVERLDWDDD